jgi:hypothetical protein
MLLSSIRTGRAVSIALLLMALPRGVSQIHCTGSTEPAHKQVSISSLRSKYEAKTDVLAKEDSDDGANLPAWFRAFLRCKLNRLPRWGQPRYPAAAAELLDWLQASGRVDQEELERRLQLMRSDVPNVITENLKNRGYSPEWEVPIKPGTKLAALAESLQLQSDTLPEGDPQDRSALPVWFRVYLRKLHPDLPKTGSYQYPRTANRILQDLLDHSDDADLGTADAPPKR